MAVWLSMSLSYGGAGDHSNTSRVNVSVTVHWDTTSYNGNNPPLNVAADGLTDTVNVSFNTGRTSSGSQTIYSKYWNIGHDTNGSARTVSFSASYATGTSSGTVSTSSSLYLNAIGGSSSGGTSGGDSGDSGDSGDDSGGSSGGGTSIPDTPSSNIQRHPDTNCIYLGSSLTGETYSNTDIILVTDAYIKFRTPSDLISCKDIRLIIPNNGFGFVFDPGTDYSRGLDIAVVRDHRYGWSGNTVITSNAFKHSGYTHYEQWECCLIKDLGATVYEDLKPDTEYVITLDTYDARFTIDTPVAIIIDYVARGGIHVKTNGMEKKYLITAKTGDTVSTYEPYVKNGDSWEPLGNVPITGEQYT